jgi:hypothetical protein
MLNVRAFRCCITFALITAGLLASINCGGSRSRAITSQNSHPDFSRVLIDLMGDNRYRQYEVEVLSGNARLVRDEPLRNDDPSQIPQDFDQPGGALEGCGEKPTAASPREHYKAQCTGTAFQDESITVFDTGQSSPIREWQHTDRSIRGFAWASDGNSIAILSETERYSKSPVGMLSALSGHPIPLSAVYLDIVNIETGRVSEVLVRAEVRYAFSRILRW